MKNKRVFDVLVVYSDGIANSPSDKRNTDNQPFSISSGRSNYNNAYAYFLETCQDFGLSAAFTTDDSVIDAGTCKSYWLYLDKSWHKVRKTCYSRQIFDKFSPVNIERKIRREQLFSSDLIQPFNDPCISSLFFDKYKTYKQLEHFAIPTVAIEESSSQGIRDALQELRYLTTIRAHSNDFSRAIIVKDRCGAGGNNIYLVAENYVKKIQTILRTHSRISFIMQPLVKFENGYSYNNYTAATDIRLIYQNGKIIQTYIRMAKADDFRCNEHQGGTLIYVKLKEIPKKVISASEAIAYELGQNNSLFALDFVVSDRGNVYFLEGNVGPGIDWNLALKKNERMSKELIQKIVAEFFSRVTDIRNSITTNDEISDQISSI